MRKYVSNNQTGRSSVELSGLSAISGAVSKISGKTSRIPKGKTAKTKKQSSPKPKSPKKNVEPESKLPTSPTLPPPVDLTKIDGPRQFKITDKRYPR
jgi:hypothetical protein